MQSPSHRPGDSSPPLGDQQCSACTSRPSHRLFPCHHTVCYDHFLAHDEESQSRPDCARCHKVVLQSLDLTDKNNPPVSVLASTFIPSSPEAEVWSNSFTSGNGFSSFEDRFNTMTINSNGPEPDTSRSPWNKADNKDSTRKSANNGPAKGHARHNSFHPGRFFHEIASDHDVQSHSDTQTAPGMMGASNVQEPVNAYPTQSFGQPIGMQQSGLQFGDMQHSSGMPQQQQQPFNNQNNINMNHQGNVQFPVNMHQPADMGHFPSIGHRLHDMHQPVNMGQPHNMNQPVSMGQPHNMHQPVNMHQPANMGQPHNVHQPVNMGQYPNMVPQLHNMHQPINMHQYPSMQQAGGPHDLSFQHGFQGNTNGYVDRIPTSFDPPGAPYNPFKSSHPGFAPIGSQPGRRSTVGGGGITPHHTPTTHFQGRRFQEPQQTEAARLAQAIKNGLFEDAASSKEVSPPVRGFTSPPPHGPEWALQQPLVRSQVVMPEIAPNPAFFDDAVNGVFPSLEDAFEHVPFVEQSRHHKRSACGVIKITNIPYGTTKNEVIAALGRNARIVSQPAGTPYYGIHIIMERSTGKTMDCYVELDNKAEVATCVSNYQQRCMSGRAPRIGERHVEIEVSSQEALMKELFPRAKCVEWNGQVPNIHNTDEMFNSGFRGFVTGEEMVMVQKHAETPQRSPFAQRCHNRTYENMISTLHKYPWFAVNSVTIAERTLLFKATITQLRSLITAVRRNSSPAMLTRPLLQELVVAALSNAGFNHQQKAFVTDLVRCNGFADLLVTVPTVHLGVLGGWWCFEVLSKKADASMELVEYYIHLLRAGAEPSTTDFSSTNNSNSSNANGNTSAGTLAKRSANPTPTRTNTSSSDHQQQQQNFGANNPFGAFKVDYGAHNPAELTLAEAAVREWDAVEAALRGVLGSEAAGGAVMAIEG